MKFTDKQLDIIKQMYTDGLSQNEMAEATGLKRTQVYHIIYKKLRLHDQTPRQEVRNSPKNEVTPYVVSRIITLTNWGYHCKEIAEDQGVHLAEVRRVIQEAENLGRIQKKV
jgi:DNA invertase Pin-like site-specific DNA recombinase